MWCVFRSKRLVRGNWTFLTIIVKLIIGRGKCMKKKNLIIAISLIMSLSCVQPVFAWSQSMDQSGGTWYQENGEWKYRLPDQNRCEGRIIYVDGYKYCFSNDGYMQTGWFTFGKSYYYADDNGHILTNAMTPDGYWVDEDGVWNQNVPQWTNPNEQKTEETTKESQASAKDAIAEYEALQKELTDEKKQYIWNQVIEKARPKLKNWRTAKFPEWNDQFIKYRVLPANSTSAEPYVDISGWCETKNGIGNYVEISIWATSSLSGVIDICSLSTN